MRVQAADDALRSDLAALVSGRASNHESDRIAYARDLWPRHVIGLRAGVVAPSPPAVIVWPESEPEIAQVVRYAAQRGIPVVPFGAGSGVCGGIAAEARAIVLDLKRMRRIRELDAGELIVSAEAGILGQILEDRLDERGFTLGHFPSSIHCSTLGGWLAARSAGQCSGRYGKIEDMALSMRFVDGTGRVVSCTRGGENAALLPLVIGSEGIFGVIASATLRIAPKPRSRRFASYIFDSTDAGLSAIRDIFQAGLRPAVCRLYDPFDTAMARRGRVKKERSVWEAHGPETLQPGLGQRALVAALRTGPGALNALADGLPVGGALLVVVWEDDARVAEVEHGALVEIAGRFRGRDAGEGPARRWLQNRHAVSYRQSPVYTMGAFVDTMEVSAPWSRMMPMYRAVHDALGQRAFVMAHFSHAYPDGASIYFTFAGAADGDARALETYDAIWRDALVAVVAAGGTISHHHGVGRSKAPAMRSEQGAAIELVRDLASLLDPRHVLNPGNLLPPAEAATSRTIAAAPVVALSFDLESRLVCAPGSASLDEIDSAARAHGLTLGVSGSQTVAHWLKQGAPGARDAGDDPVDQCVAGLTFERADGTPITVRPAPRRATGPDLASAVVTARGGLGAVREAWLHLRPVVQQRTQTYAFASRERATRARAWLRGLGARPVDTRMVAADGLTLLRIVIADDGRRADAAEAIVRECCEREEGQRLDAPRDDPERTTIPPRADFAAELFERLA